MLHRAFRTSTSQRLRPVGRRRHVLVALCVIAATTACTDEAPVGLAPDAEVPGLSTPECPSEPVADLAEAEARLGGVLSCLGLVDHEATCVVRDNWMPAEPLPTVPEPQHPLTGRLRIGRPAVECSVSSSPSSETSTSVGVVRFALPEVVLDPVDAVFSADAYPSGRCLAPLVPLVGATIEGPEVFIEAWDAALTCSGLDPAVLEVACWGPARYPVSVDPYFICRLHRTDVGQVHLGHQQAVSFSSSPGLFTRP